MKNRRNAVIQLAVLLALGAAMVLTLVLPGLSAGQKKVQHLEISVLIRESDSTLWSNARLGMEQAAGELGAELRFLTLTTPNDSAEQADLLRREADRGADVLAVVPADPADLEVRLKEAVRQLPVISMESALEGAALTVAPDNGALGRALAQAALEDWKGGTILLLDTSPASTGVRERLDNAREVLEDVGAPILVSSCPLERLAEELPLLIQGSGADQLLTFEPAATQRAAESKVENGLHQPLYGLGVTSGVAAWMEKGTVSAVAAWSDYAAGYLMVEGAVRTARGEPCDMEPLPFSVVRGEEIYDADNQKLLFPVTS